MPESQRPDILFIAGSDTDVGKTYTAALLARQLRHSGKRVGVYKPVASGCPIRDGQTESEDAKALWQAAGCPLDLDAVCPQRFLAPVAPNRAAIMEGKRVDEEMLLRGAEQWFSHCDVLVVEGAGGLMSPLSDEMLNVDLALALAPLRLLIVVANRLGAIHQSLATCAAAEHRGLKPAGIILCETSVGGVAIEHNVDEISHRTDVPILAQISHGEDCMIAIERMRP